MKNFTSEISIHTISTYNFKIFDFINSAISMPISCLMFRTFLMFGMISNFFFETLKMLISFFKSKKSFSPKLKIVWVKCKQYTLLANIVYQTPFCIQKNVDTQKSLEIIFMMTFTLLFSCINFQCWYWFEDYYDELLAASRCYLKSLLALF